MPRLKAANNARTTLAAAIDAVQTSFTVTDASLFPDPPFRITVDAEIMEVGAIDRVTKTFSNVTRGVEGTAAAPHAAGASVENRFTAGTYDELATSADVNAHAAATTAHGSTSAATAGAIMQRDAYGRAKVAAPSATDDIARKAEIDAVQANLNSHISAADPHSQYALDSDLNTHKTAATLDHPDQSVTSAKLASGAVIAGKIADGGVDTLARIAAGIRTSAGGTEANRLAVTNASGRVGAAEQAVNADTVDGLHASAFAQIAKGSYTGDGTSGRTIAVGFTPKMVYVVGAAAVEYGAVGLGLAGVGYGVAKLATTANSYLARHGSSYYVPQIVTNGFQVSAPTDLPREYHLNYSGQIYHWVAIG